MAKHQYMAPDLYKLAYRKDRMVYEELQGNQWTRGLSRINTIDQMAQDLMLWDLVQGTRLNDQPDQIKWIWTGHGQ